jgi:ankyrin repeat protein
MRYSDFETANFLLRQGADVDFYNAAGMTPLHEAVWNQDQFSIYHLGHWYLLQARFRMS